MGLLWVSFKMLLSKIDFESFQNGSTPPVWEQSKCPHIWFSEKRAENKLLGRWGTYRRKNNLGGWRSMEGLEAGKNQGMEKSLFKAFLITLHLHSWVRTPPLAHTRMWLMSQNPCSRNGKQPIPVFLPGTFHGQRRLVGYCQWGRKKLDTTEWLNMHSTPPPSHTTESVWVFRDSWKWAWSLEKAKTLL